MDDPTKWTSAIWIEIEIETDYNSFIWLRLHVKFDFLWLLVTDQESEEWSD